MSFRDLLRREPRAIAFGFIYSFGSSGGQTFLISLFVPSIAAALALGAGDFGYLYGLATICAALILPVFGRLIDRVDLLAFGIASGVLMALASGLVAASTGIVTLFVGVMLLRFAGQGLMTHTAMTAASRYFTTDRGRALSLSGLGHAAGEGLLPLLAVMLIASIGWRWSLLSSGLVLGLLAAVSAAWLVRDAATFRQPVPKPAAAAGAPAFSIWRLPLFWALLPILLASPFTTTGLIFHQALIAEAAGMPLALFAGLFGIFALAQIPGSLLIGPWIDRLSARGLLPWHLLPAMLGIALFALFGTIWSVVAYFALLGFSVGIGATLRAAAIAEMVPAREMGAARSVATAAMVLATAAGPAAFGLLLSAGQPPVMLLWMAIAVTGVATLSAFVVQWRFPLRTA